LQRQLSPNSCRRPEVADDDEDASGDRPPPRTSRRCAAEVGRKKARQNARRRETDGRCAGDLIDDKLSVFYAPRRRSRRRALRPRVRQQFLACSLVRLSSEESTRNWSEASSKSDPIDRGHGGSSWTTTDDMIFGPATACHSC
jgi:hypothetical protein